MKSLRIGVILLVGLLGIFPIAKPVPVRAAAITRVAAVSVHTGNTSTIDTSSADFLLGFTANWPSLGIIRDQVGSPACAQPCNTWTQLTQTSSGGNTAKFFYVANPTKGTGHFFNTDGAFPGVSIVAYSGVKLSSPADQSAQTTATSTTGQAGSITPSENCELVAAGVGIGSNGVSASSIDGGFSIATSIAANSNLGSAIADLIQTSAAAANPTWTMSGSTLMNLHIASFKAETCGGATPVPQILGFFSPWRALSARR